MRGIGLLILLYLLLCCIGSCDRGCARAGAGPPKEVRREADDADRTAGNIEFNCRMGRRDVERATERKR
jgi:hypothetical protein